MSQLIQSQSVLHISIENIKNGYKNIINHMKLLQQKRETRRQLMKLPKYLHQDIGLNEEQVQHEIGKSFWSLK